MLAERGWMSERLSQRPRTRATQPSGAFCEAIALVHWARHHDQGLGLRQRACLLLKAKVKVKETARPRVARACTVAMADFRPSLVVASSAAHSVAPLASASRAPSQISAQTKKKKVSADCDSNKNTKKRATNPCIGETVRPVPVSFATIVELQKKGHTSATEETKKKAHKQT